MNDRHRASGTGPGLPLSPTDSLLLLLLAGAAHERGASGRQHADQAVGALDLTVAGERPSALPDVGPAVYPRAR